MPDTGPDPRDSSRRLIGYGGASGGGKRAAFYAASGELARSIGAIVQDLGYVPPSEEDWKEIMTESTDVTTDPRVTVSWTKASTKDGNTGYHIHVAEDCDAGEASRVFGIALALKERADAVLLGVVDVPVQASD